MSDTSMKLWEFTTETTGEGDQIVRAGGRIADQRDPDAQTQWIEFQLEFGAPTVRNGALLRRGVLVQASEILRELADHFDNLGQRN